jgi:hypothetical protein
MKARANPATAAPFPKTRIPLGVGCHVLTAGAFGSSEELARVISISEVDLDSDDSDGDSDISSAKRSSGGDLSKKKLYELLFSKDGATLSKVSVSRNATSRPTLTNLSFIPCSLAPLLALAFVHTNLHSHLISMHQWNNIFSTGMDAISVRKSSSSCTSSQSAPRSTSQHGVGAFSQRRLACRPSRRQPDSQESCPRAFKHDLIGNQSDNDCNSKNTSNKCNSINGSCSIKHNTTNSCNQANSSFNKKSNSSNSCI